jgi:flagellar basal body L-ring protein FlgH
MSRRIMLLAAAAFAAAGLAACGEQPQVVVYKQGAYQGKPDQPAWAGAPWNGNKTEWDTAIRTRNQNQNEYKRTN